MKHKHAEVIKAFVDGIECEWFGRLNNEWHLISELKEFDWVEKVRIKPEPKPDFDAIVIMQCVFDEKVVIVKHKIIFDGETSNLKRVEVIKNV